MVLSAFNRYLNLNEDPTFGDRIIFRVFEIFVLSRLMQYSWKWTLGSLTIDQPTIYRGLNNVFDLSFLSSQPAAFISFGLILLFFTFGFFRKLTGVSYLTSMVVLHCQSSMAYSVGHMPHKSYLLGLWGDNGTRGDSFIHGD